MAGAPSKYNRKIADKIVLAIANGCSKDEAAEYAGISPATLYSWQNSHPELLDRIARARAKIIPELHNVIMERAQTDADYAIRALKLFFPERYSKRLTIEGDPEKPVEIKTDVSDELKFVAQQLSGLTVEQLLELRTRQKLAPKLEETE